MTLKFLLFEFCRQAKCSREYFLFLIGSLHRENSLCCSSGEFLLYDCSRGEAKRFKNIIFQREKRREEKRDDGLENNLVKSFPLILTVSKISYLCSVEPI